MLITCLRASEDTLSRWSRLHLPSLAPTNPHWARVVGYGPFSLCVIYKEGRCPSSGDINRPMIMLITALSNSSWKLRHMQHEDNMRRLKMRLRHQTSVNLLSSWLALPCICVSLRKLSTIIFPRELRLTFAWPLLRCVYSFNIHATKLIRFHPTFKLQKYN
jgi:hypothetical protein